MNRRSQKNTTVFEIRFDELSNTQEHETADRYAISSKQS